MSKRADINQAVLSGAPGAGAKVAPSEPREPVSHIGKMGQMMVGGLARENEKLKGEIAALRDERGGGGLVIELDPKEIAHSRFVNRHALSLSLDDPDFTQLLESLRENEQDQEILVRPAPPEATHGKPYEVAFGHRRHAAGLILDKEQQPAGWKIKARIKELSDLELVEVMDRENTQRKGVSPYEIGWHLLKCLQEGVYESQADIAKKKNLSRAIVTKYIQTAELPEEILNAFRDPRVIRIAWVQDLQQALTTRKDMTLSAALELCEEQGTREPESVFEALLEGPKGSPSASKQSSAPAEEQIFRLPGSKRVGLKTLRKRGSLRIKWGPGIDEEYQRNFATALRSYAEEYLRDHPPAPPPTAAASARKKK